MKTFVLTLVLGLLLLAAALAYIAADWDFSAMSLHLWIALGLGTVLSLLVGGGLMALVFYSSRHGYDDRVDTRLDDNEP